MQNQIYTAFGNVPLTLKVDIGVHTHPLRTVFSVDLIVFYQALFWDGSMVFELVLQSLQRV